MAKLPRAIMKVFGSNGSSTQFGKFGSLAAGAPTTTKDVTLIQSLGNYLNGWFDAILANNSPALEDRNAIDYLYAYQLAYLFQAGVPEWQAGTSYYIGSLASDSGNVFVSLIDDNLGNSISDTTKWRLQGSRIRTVTASDTALPTDDYIRCDSSGGGYYETLPPLSTVPAGKKIIVKNITNGPNLIVVKGTGAETVDGNNSYQTPLGAYDSVTVISTGTAWEVI